MSIRLMAIGLVGALALGTAVSASAGPLPIGNSGLKAAAGPDTTEVYWRRGFGYGPGIAFGLATGALIGAAVAAGPYGYYGGYGPGYGYGYGYGPTVYVQPRPVYPGYYGAGYGYYGGYAYNPYGYGRCFTDEGYGRRRACNAQ